jgi:hypothetical protein
LRKIEICFVFQYNNLLILKILLYMYPSFSNPEHGSVVHP